MATTHRPRRTLPALLLIAVLAACGGDDPAAGTANPAADPSTTAPADNAGSREEAVPTPAGAEGGGEVTVGDTTWSFVPTVQCMIASDGTFAVIAGEAADDPTVEISLDVSPEDSRFDVNVDGRAMFARGDALVTTVDDGSVSGTAALSDGSDTQEAAFELTCA